MLKYELQAFKQHGETIYSFTADPRDIIPFVNIPKPGELQEAQRPFKEPKVKEISKYTAGKLILSQKEHNKALKAKGLLPGSAIINLIDKSFLSSEKQTVIHTDGTSEEREIFILKLPDTPEEIKKAKGLIQILDCQHRLISFSEDYIDSDFKTNNVYEMVFVLFSDLLSEDKLELHMIINTKQDKYDQNLILAQQYDLGLLAPENKRVLDLISDLNREDSSPLKGRIIVSAEKITYGIKRIQLEKVLQNSKTFQKIKKFDEKVQLKIILNYLNAWKSIFTGAFENPKHILSKMGGLRFIFYMFPICYETLANNNKTLSHTNFKDLLFIYKNIILPELGDIFADKDLKTTVFRGESSTTSKAIEHAEKLMYISKKEINQFDLVAGI